MWWLSLVARGGTPVHLPAGEQAGDWVGVLALGGLDWASGGAPISVEDRGATWVITVADPAGHARVTSVAPPRTPEAREDLVWLVVSLASSVDAPPPVAPEDPPIVARAAPRPPAPPRPTGAVAAPTGGLAGKVVGGAPPVSAATAKAPPPAPPTPGPVAPAPVAVPPPSPRPAAVAAPPPRPPKAPREPLRLPVPPDDPGLRPWARIASGVALRSGLGARPTGVISGGVAQDRRAVGLAAALGGRGRLPGVGPERTWTGWELAVEGWTGPRFVRVGGAAGAEVRRFFQGSEPVAVGAMPFVRLDLAADLYVGRRLSIEPGLDARLDLGVTEIRVDGHRVGDVPSRALTPTLAVRWR